jgi:GLPGLI family protein
VVYHNFETGKCVTQSELGAKNYIVEDSIATLAWTITAETKELLGYTVQKATARRYGTRLVMGMENGKLQAQELPDTSVIIAWFAPKIPVPAGPGYAGQLPGLVLELDENGGHSVYKAIEISSKVNLAAIREPKGGKRISAAAFRTEQQKTLQEMRRHMQEGRRVSRPFPSGN